jgi:hypothetical protein
MQAVIEHFEPLRRLAARLGPYALLELLLPGGTLFALLLFLYQRAKTRPGKFATRLASPPALVATTYVAPVPCSRLACSC